MIGSCETELVMEARVEQWYRETRPAIERQGALERQLSGRVAAKRRLWPVMISRLMGRLGAPGVRGGRPGADAPAAGA